MDIKEYYQDFSQARFQRYLSAVNNDLQSAYKLYKQQEILSGYLHSLLHCFEVAMRNRINAYMCTKFHENWLIYLTNIGSPLNTKDTVVTYKILCEAKDKLAKKNKLTNNDMVASVHFGYWTGIFQRRQLLVLNDLPVEAFKFAPKWEHLKKIDIIRNNLNHCRQMRNKVAHLEPLIFASGSSRLSFKQIDRCVKNVLELSAWLGIDMDIYRENIVLLETQKEVILRIVNYNH